MVRASRERARSEATRSDDRLIRRRLVCRGAVQGVGFRPFVYRLAREEGVRGFVRNDSSGVTIEAFGPAPVLESFCRRLRDSAPPPARVRDLRSQRIEAREAPGFVISASAHAHERRVSIPADLGTCDTCMREVLDPRDRRHRAAGGARRPRGAAGPAANRPRAGSRGDRGHAGVDRAARPGDHQGQSA